MTVTITKRLRLRVSAVAAALAGAALISPGLAAAKNPILFVHGYASSGSAWDTMISRFRADGWPSSRLYTITYNSYQSNTSTAYEIQHRINQIRSWTGAAKVDVITHSMGGLSSRWYLKHLGGTSHVDEWVSIGGPNHGSTNAYYCYSTSCYEMRPGSTFLNSLNSGDETPGGVRYGTFWSSCDAFINPDSSVRLSGASNHYVGCLGHNYMLRSSSVYRKVRDFVRW